MKIKKEIKYSYEKLIQFVDILKVELIYKSNGEKGCGEIIFNLYQLPNKYIPLQIYSIQKCDFGILENLFTKIVKDIELINSLEEIENYLKEL